MADSKGERKPNEGNPEPRRRHESGRQRRGSGYLREREDTPASSYRMQPADTVERVVVPDVSIPGIERPRATRSARTTRRRLNSADRETLAESLEIVRLEAARQVIEKAAKAAKKNDQRYSSGRQPQPRTATTPLCRIPVTQAESSRQVRSRAGTMAGFGSLKPQDADVDDETDDGPDDESA